MIHYTSDGYEVDVLGKLLPYIRYKQYPIVDVRLEELSHKGFNINVDGARYIQANTNYPLIVTVENMFVIDGRHRLLKLYNSQAEFAKCYLIETDILNIFKEKRG